MLNMIMKSCQLVVKVLLYSSFYEFEVLFKTRGQMRLLRSNRLDVQT